MSDHSMTTDQATAVGEIAKLLPDPNTPVGDGGVYLGGGSVIEVMDDDWMVGRFVLEDDCWLFYLGAGGGDDD